MACAAVGLEETPRSVVGILDAVLHSPDFTPRTPGSIDEKQTASELLRLLCLSPLLNASPNLCVTETTTVASSLILDRVQICHSLLDLCQPPATLDLSIGPCHGKPTPTPAKERHHHRQLNTCSTLRTTTVSY
ncbi:hypothetical protein HBI39_128990 [Parastagonospora nodorum]|nr:hypothetical protein HBI39_128990 [Parastagonospora nodorum]